MSSEIDRLPGCVAQYDPEDGVCNGSEDDPKPCAWRDMCGAFQKFLEQRGEDREEYLDLHEDEDGQNYSMAAATTNDEFAEFCTEQADVYGVENGIPTKEPPEEGEPAPEEGEPAPEEGEPAPEEGEPAPEVQKPKKPKTKKTKKSKKSKKNPGERKHKSQRTKERQGKLMELFEHFMCALYDHFPADRRTSPQQIPSAGQFFAIDRRGSGYISVYCKSGKGKDVPVAMLRPKPRTMTMDIEMPLDVDAMAGISKSTSVKFGDVAVIADGRFKTILKGFDKEKLALLAETIGKFAKDGVITLPEI
jgi:hypothetical protein